MLKSFSSPVFAVCAVQTTTTVIVPVAEAPHILIIKHQLLLLTNPSTKAPRSALGTLWLLFFTLMQGLVKARVDKKPGRSLMLCLCRASSGEQKLRPTAESWLQVNCDQHKRNKTGIVWLNSCTSLHLTYEAGGYRWRAGI